MATTENGSLAWKRPSGPAKVWKRFEINDKAGSDGKDGKVLRFSIEEIPSERHEEVLDLMVNYFAADEPQSRCLNIKDDPDAVEDFRKLWRVPLSQGIIVGLFLDDPEVDKREIVGLNLLLVVKREDEEMFNKFKFKSVTAKAITDFIMTSTAEANVLDRYKVDRYMSAHGLLVIPRFRGYSLGGHLLGVRTLIGRKYKIPVTVTSFSAPAAQTLARRNGFEVLVEKKFSEVHDDEGELLFPNINSENIKLMAKRLY